jgi:hypothetical protein
MLTPYKYLKEEVYYNDLYDRLTVAHCRRMEKPNTAYIDEEVTAGKISEREAEMQKKWVGTVIEVMLYSVAGEEYEKKAKPYGIG